MSSQAPDASSKNPAASVARPLTATTDRPVVASQTGPMAPPTHTPQRPPTRAARPRRTTRSLAVQASSARVKSRASTMPTTRPIVETSEMAAVTTSPSPTMSWAMTSTTCRRQGSVILIGPC